MQKVMDAECVPYGFDKLPDGWEFHKRDNPEMPCVIANKCILVIVLVLASPFLLLAMIIIVPLSCYTRKWKSKVIADRILNDGSKVIETSKGPVEYLKLGPGPPYVLYVPGGGGGVQELAGEDGEKLLKKTHQDRGVGIITFARPGYGRTPISSGRRWAEQADLMAALLDALHIKSVVVCGRSGGGPTAVHFAARHPEKCAGLLLFYCNLYPVGTLSKTLPKKPFFPWNVRLMYWMSHFSVMEWMSWYKAPKDPQGLKYFLDACLQGFSDYDKEERAAEVERLAAIEPLTLKILTDVLPNCIGALQGPECEGNMNDHFHQVWDMRLPFNKILCPTILAHGKRDNDNSFEHSLYASKEIKDARLFTLEKGYHACDAFDPEFEKVVWEECLKLIKSSA